MPAYTTIKDGYWDDVVPATCPWSGGVKPVAGDTVTITHKITIRGNEIIGSAGAVAVTIDVGGRLKWADGVDLVADWTFEVRGGTSAIRVNTGGIFEIGNEVTPVAVGRVATLWFSTTGGSIYSAGGAIKLYGSAITTVQRTKVAAAVLAGAAAFTVDDAPDWVNGQTLWLGVGGDIATAPTTSEKVTVDSVVGNTVNIVGVLANNHADGDFVVLQDRNVNVVGKSATEGGNVYCDLASMFPAGFLFNLEWARFNYTGRGAGATLASIGFNVAVTGDLVNAIADVHHVTDCIFDLPGAASTSVFSLYGGNGVNYGDLDYSRNHVYGTFRVAFYLAEQYCVGRINFDDSTVIQPIIVEKSYSYSPLEWSSDGLWACGASRSVAAYQYAFKYCVPDNLENFFITNYGNVAYRAPVTVNEYAFNSSRNVLFDTGILCHIGSAAYILGIEFGGSDFEYFGSVTFKDVVFRDFHGSAILLTSFAGRLFIEDCSFDQTNVGGGATGVTAALVLSPTTSGCGHIVRITNSTFGTIVQNDRFNISAASDTSLFGYAAVRLVCTGCVFKEPTNFAWATVAPGQSFCQDAVGWMFRDHGRKMNTWTYRTRIGADRSMEFIECQSLNAAGVDQLPAILGLATHFMIGAGGGEIYDEPLGGTVIDNSYGVKMQPCNCVAREELTRFRPVDIPVAAGQVITAKLSFQKNVAQAAGRRPALHLRLPGQNLSQEMTDAIATWDEVTIIAAAAAYDCVAQLWVSCRNEPEAAGVGWSPAFRANFTPAAIGTVIVYADGLSITVA